MPQQEMKRPAGNDIALFAADGSYVTSVTRPAGGAPELVVWGTRFFVKRFGSYREAETIAHTQEAQR
jgi:hypothetical protein